MSALKKTGAGCVVALYAVFGMAANTANAQSNTRMEQAALGSDAAQIARSLYIQPANDDAFNKAKAALLKLPSKEIRAASAAYHELAFGERKLMCSVGLSLAWNDGKHVIDDIASPEIHAGLLALKQQIESDKKSGNKIPAYDRMMAVIKKLDTDSQLREKTFKNLVSEAVREKFAVEHNQKPSR